MKGKELFKQLSEKSGITADDKDLVTFLAANENIEIPDSIANAFIGKLMNESEAKLNPTVVSHLKQNTLAGVDKRIFDLLADLGFDDVAKTKITGEKNTFEKVAVLAKEIQALEKAKIGTAKGDKEALQKEIDRLNTEAIATADRYKKEIEQVKEASANEVLNYAIDAYLSSMNYANKDIPKEANVATARFLIEKGLNEAKAKVTRDGNALKLFRTDDTGLPYTENHKEVTFNAFADKVLSTNKLLHVGNTQTQQRQQHQQQQHSSKTVEIDPVLQAHYAEQMAQFQNGH